MAETNEQKSLTLKELIAKNYNCSEKVISDLKAGLQRDFTIIEACVYAGITSDTYYRWLKESDEFREEMDRARQHMSELSKKVIMDAVEKGDKDSAKWWLERRKKELYSTRTETDLTSKGDKITGYVVEIIDKTSDIEPHEEEDTGNESTGGDSPSGEGEL